ncbi:peptidylprolyl isomerase [bacterium]|nr:peptidylprolyl isomerase [bacterium]
MVMRFFRRHFAAIIWITIFVFVGGFVILSSVNFIQKNKNVVFKIGKNNYYVKDYMDRLEKTRQGLIKQGKDYEEKQLKGDVLDGMLNEALIARLGKELNISVGKNDIMNYIKGQKYFLQSGEFDYDQYKTVLSQNNLSPSLYESQVKVMLLQNQLYGIINKAQAISPLFLLDQNRSFQMSDYIKFTTLDKDYFKDLIKIGNDDLKNYYSKHMEDYFVQPQVKIAYKELPVEITQKDIDSIINQLNEIKDEIMKKKLTFTDAAKMYSEGPSASKGGELGWFDKDTMVPEFTKIVFAMKKGEISKPFKTKFGYHIVQLEDIKKENGKTKVLARHILLKLVITDEQKDNVYNDAMTYYSKLKNEELSKFFKDAKITEFVTQDDLPYKDMEDVFDYKKSGIAGYPFYKEDSNTSKSFWVLYQLIDKKEGYYKPLEKVEEDITKKVEEEKIDRYLDKSIKEITKSIKEEDWKEVNFTVFSGIIEPIFGKIEDEKQKEKYTNASKDIIKKLNELTKGEEDYYNFNDEIYLFVLLKKELPPLKEGDIAGAKNSYFYNFIVQSSYGDFLRYLREKYNIKIFRDRIGL